MTITLHKKSRISLRCLNLLTLCVSFAIFAYMCGFVCAEDGVDDITFDPSVRSLPAWEKPDSRAIEDLSQQVHRLSSGVFLLGHPDVGTGTGFVISKKHRLLATNAHVADMRDKADDFFAIGDNSSQVLYVDQVWYHPGVVRVSKTGLLVRSQDSSVGDVSPLGPDVAVVHLAGSEELPAELPLATQEEIHKLFSKPVGMIGYPGHDTAHWPALGKRPHATHRQGVVARATDFSNDADAATADLQYLQHTMASWFGFSGSPVFLANGKVVALNNAGSSVEKAGLVTSLAYAVRVDCLWELLSFHGLDDKMPIPVDRDLLRLHRFEGEDPQLRKLSDVKDLIQRGRILTAGSKWAEAGEVFNRAVDLAPNYARVYEWKGHNHYEFATYLTFLESRNQQLDLFLTQSELALKAWKKAMELDPSNVVYILNALRARRYVSAGLRRSFRGFDIPEDRVIIDRLLDLEGLTPYEKASAYDMYANTFRFTKQSLPWRVKAVESLPYDGALLENRAESYGNIREYVLAQRDRKRATELNDAFQKNLKAWHLATSQTAGERDGVTAVDLAQQACQITNFKCWYMLETLAAANAEAGNYDEAQKWAKKAMEIAHDKDKTRIAQALRVYRKSQPWRE